MITYVYALKLCHLNPFKMSVVYLVTTKTWLTKKDSSLLQLLVTTLHAPVGEIWFHLGDPRGKMTLSMMRKKKILQQEHHKEKMMSWHLTFVCSTGTTQHVMSQFRQNIMQM